MGLCKTPEHRARQKNCRSSYKICEREPCRCNCFRVFGDKGKDIREKDFDGVCAHMGNVLESVTIPNYPVIAEIKQQMMRSGAKASMMSGSGPTVFGLFEDGETAKRALREMKRSGLAKQVYLTTIYNNRRK